jgi:hypothetical protein
MRVKWNAIGLVKDLIRFGIAVAILYAGYPLLALSTLAFFDVTIHTR